MKVTIVSDQHGNIVSISQPGDVGDKISGIVKSGMVPAPGQIVHEIELTPELEKAGLLALHTTFKVDVNKGALVKA